MSTSGAKRVALVGASGIGKHHAKWWHLEGAEVCGFAGTSPESVEKARGGLCALFDFSGRGYTSLDALIDGEQPGIVDVCSPPSRHFQHVKRALEAGCHVLCEKPFVYDPELPDEAMLEQARELTALAGSKHLLLGICTQYVVSARMIRDIWNRTQGNRLVSRFGVHLASPARGRGPDPERIWIDLGPHPLSGLQELSRGGTILWDTVSTTFRGYEARAAFQALRSTGETLDCEIVTGNQTAPPSHIREVMLDDTRYVIEGENDADGIYGARIDVGDVSYSRPDFMRVLVRDFLSGTPTADGHMATVNLEWLLRILGIARRQSA